MKPAVHRAGDAPRVVDGRWIVRVRRVVRTLVALFLVALAGPPSWAEAQETDDPSGMSEPEMPVAPVQFQVAGMVSSFDWSAPAEGGAEVEDVLMFGAEVESILFRYASIRLGTSFGRPTLRVVEPAMGDEPRTADVNQFLIDLTLVGRLDVGPWARVGLVPYGLASFGSVVHAPRGEPGLITKNQNVYTFGGGLEWSGFRGLGLRVEWREGTIDHDSLFEPQDRESADRDLRRIVGQIFWTF